MRDKAVLEGGPVDLPERVVDAPSSGEDLKIPYRGGYEHYRPTARVQDGPLGSLRVFEWWERTEIAG
ncbi:DUF5988 family protein [Streptomyces sp. NPDC048550]|uniref:DUF5988 family protein n=1 Tax=unclassified Streptomyces TaxID=2593676 RepID=UPI0034273455